MLRVHQLRVDLGEFRLRDLSLTVARGEYFVVLGPTGSGKTVLIECVAGLLRPAAGEVWIEGRDVTRDAPETRRIGYLPQDYALFPHLTVRENLQFGLRVQRRLAASQARLASLVDMLGIGRLLDRFPGTLSGGEKQRVALGRALVVEPRLVLLDEPLSALDVATRQQIGRELREIHERTGITTVHISHDFEETIRLADRVALVHDGRVVQVGTPQELFRQPASLFAARFVRAENVLAGTVAEDGAGDQVRVGTVELACTTDLRGPVWVVLRSDDLQLLPEGGTTAGFNRVRGCVRRVEDRGPLVAVEVEGDLALTVLLSRTDWRRLKPSPGEAVTVGFPPEAVHLLCDRGDDDPGGRAPEGRAESTVGQ